MTFFDPEVTALSSVMANAATTQMKLVFRVGGVGCSLPVEHLIEVVEFQFYEIDDSSADPDSAVVGDFAFREERLPIVDLAAAFGLRSCLRGDNLVMLVVAGGEGPWGAVVERVDGVYPATTFKTVDMPIALLCGEKKLYTQLDIWEGAPLVCLEPYRIDRYRTAGCL